MDLGAIMKQAQQMQAEMAKAQEELKDEVLEHVDVVGVNCLRVDLELLEIQVAAHLHRDHAAADRGLDRLVLEVFLGLRHLGLHLLGLLEDRSEVGLLGHQFSAWLLWDWSTSTAPKSRLTLSMSSSVLSVFSSGGGALSLVSSEMTSVAPVRP
jgi:hypothetical protein